MSIPELHPEIWAHIIGFLERPKPKTGTSHWKDLHQHDLATMMRTSKMFFDQTAPLLYREPIVENLWSFFETGDQFYHYRFPDHEASPVENTKAICLKYVRKFHLIHLIGSHQFLYSNLFTVLALPGLRTDIEKLWMMLHLLDDGASDSGRKVMNRILGAEHKVHATYKMLSGLRGRRGGRAFHPRTVTFGAWGDRSWDTVHSSLAHDMVSEELLPARMMMQKMSEDISAFVESIHCEWPNQIKVHCSHFVGGPLGSFERYIHNWGESDPPEITITHVHRADMTYGITLGKKNVVIYHPDTPRLDWDTTDPNDNRSIGCSSVWDYKIGNLLLEKKADLVEEQLKTTEIDIYGLPGHERSVDLMFTQDILDKLLVHLKGKVKFHPYKEAPSCPACGWAREG